MNKKLKRWVSLMAAVMVIPSMLYASSATCSNPWDCYKKGDEYFKQGQYELAVKEYEHAAKALPDQASIHNSLAKAYEQVGRYQLASDHYGIQAAIYKEKGEDINSYLAAKRKSDELNSTIEIYEKKAASVSEVTLGKYEPAAGAYIGAFISAEQEYEDAKYFGNDGLNEFEAFNEITGKKHATFFDYGSPGVTVDASFQGRQMAAIEAGGALHIGYEPNGGLDEVTEPVIRQYAEELRDLEVPIFLRYASEMNGQWVAWHGDPDKYIEKWIMVYEIMEEVAPNVAMVWSPSEMPLDEIDAYYPGDEYVDWVGISIYNAQFENGDATKPTDRRNALEAIDYIYERYADRKPIMISEYGASHEAGFGEDRQDTSAFAKAKMTYFYESIKLRYPRVKSIQWYSRNNYSLTDPTKQRVNYSLLEGEDTGVLATYQNIIQDEYFLSDIVNGPGVAQQTTLPAQYTKVDSTLKATGDVTLSSWVKSYDPYINQVVYKLNGERFQTVMTAPYEVTIPYDQLKSGSNTLEVVAFDSNLKVAKQETIEIQK